MPSIEAANIHVYPLNDMLPHDVEHGTECWCQPAVVAVVDGARVIAHTSADGRELIERHGLQ